MPSSSSSPRKTRSRSRLVSTSPGDSQTKVSDPHMLTPPANDSLAIPTIPVMKASSMEPVLDLPAPTEKKPRHKMTDSQLQRLEELYQANTHPSRDAKETLAKEVGMTFKSVLIWFQNRRQDRPRKRKTLAAASPARTRVESTSKAYPKTSQTSAHSTVAKAKTTAGADSNQVFPGMRTIRLSDATTAAHGTGLYLRTDVHIDHPTPDFNVNSSLNHPLTSVFPCRPPPVSHSPVSSSETLSFDDTSHHLRKQSIPDSHLQQSATVSPASTSATLPPADPPRGAPLPFTDNSNFLLADTPRTQVSRVRNLDLEWACANSAARRDHGIFAYRDEDDSADDSSSDDEQQYRHGRGPESVARAARRSRRPGRRVAVPREYHALFSPDVVQGASLLLTLKHSED